jgi:N utilization substance protein A
VSRQDAEAMIMQARVMAGWVEPEAHASEVDEEAEEA